MSVRPLVELSSEFLGERDTILRRPCAQVTDFGPAFQAQIEDLVDTLMHHRIAVGLAAPQIGIPLQVCAINLKQAESATIVLVNPVLQSSSGKKDRKKESCMSVPHFRGEVERRDKTHIAFISRFGEPRTLDAAGFLSRVILHELDHLAGMLYLDRIDDWSNLESVTFFKTTET